MRKMFSIAHKRISVYSCRWFYNSSRLFNHANYFKLLDLPESYDIPHTDLVKHYRRLVREHHPDRFHHLSQHERDLKEQKTRQINEAFQTLSDPLKRGLYFLQLKNSPIKEDQLHIDQEIVGRVFLINEEIDECHSVEKLHEIKEENDRVRNDFDRKIAAAFGKNDIDEAKHLVSQLKYFNTIQERIKELELKLGVVR